MPSHNKDMPKKHADQKDDESLVDYWIRKTKECTRWDEK